MADLDRELWSLGVDAKTKHNEAAPAQHELAPIYGTANMAIDQNLLIMEYMRRTAEKHGMACLLHEKPFARVNGSGKHDNWALATDGGKNLLKAGRTPAENRQFLLFLAAVVKAVDEYQDLLRLSVASAGNDHRLGGNEAPPAIVSMFIGDELEAVVESIVSGHAYNGAGRETMNLGVPSVPTFTRDATDRNRTSPFAFTGNKFEFRMLGSSNSIACANIMLNSAVAESLKIYADKLEGEKDFAAALHDLIKETVKEHKRIIFNGNGYDDAWIKEATTVRGLKNYRTTPDCMPHLLDEKNVRMLTSHKVFTVEELKSRCEIMLENYCKSVTIEANTMIDMAKTAIAPAVERFTADLAKNAAAKKAVAPSLACVYETDLIGKLSALTDRIYSAVGDLESSVIALRDSDGVIAESEAIRDDVLQKMCALRLACDEAETVTEKKYWPYPTYADILFSVR